MKQTSIKLADPIVTSIYQKHPEAFDSKDDRAIFRLFIVEYLGLPLNPLAEYRLEKGITYETFRRTKQFKVQKGEIKLSEEAKKARHISEQQTRQTARVMKKEKPQKKFEPVLDTMGRIISYRPVVTTV